MGAILDLVEKLKSPAGIVVFLLIVAVGYLFIRWVFKDEQPKQ